MKLKMKNKSQRHDINRIRSRQRDKYTKCKMCLSIMMVLCIKQHLSNIWSSIHEKIKQHWGCVEKKALLIKNLVNQKKPCVIILKQIYNSVEFLKVGKPFSKRNLVMIISDPEAYLRLIAVNCFRKKKLHRICSTGF